MLICHLYPLFFPFPFRFRTNKTNETSNVERGGPTVYVTEIVAEMILAFEGFTTLVCICMTL